MKRVIILNDIYILSECRGKGIGQALIQKARRYAKDKEASKLRLFTTKDNMIAKRLYEHLGFINQQGFDMFELVIP